MLRIVMTVKIITTYFCNFYTEVFLNCIYPNNQLGKMFYQKNTKFKYI